MIIHLHANGDRFRAMRTYPLQVFCDDVNCTWSLSLESTGDGVSALCLSNAPLELTGARAGRIVAEIRDPRQVDAMVTRVGDPAEPPSDLAVELIDLLVTLSQEKPSTECLDFMRWRLCEWIVENRRGCGLQQQGNVA
jgi:hypothetical protein